MLANNYRSIDHMKEKFYRFMQGRYGSDELSKFLTGLGMALIILNLITRIRIFV